MRRTCHVANGFSFAPTNLGDMRTFFVYPSASSYAVNVCNPSSEAIPSSLIMPNSKITFDRFWTTHIVANRDLNPAGAPIIDLPGLMANYVSSNQQYGLQHLIFFTIANSVEKIEEIG